MKKRKDAIKFTIEVTVPSGWRYFGFNLWTTAQQEVLGSVIKSLMPTYLYSNNPKVDNQNFLIEVTKEKEVNFEETEKSMVARYIVVNDDSNHEGQIESKGRTLAEAVNSNDSVSLWLDQGKTVEYDRKHVYLNGKITHNIWKLKS